MDLALVYIEFLGKAFGGSFEKVKGELVKGNYRMDRTWM